MTTLIERWGNSDAVRIPTPILRAAGLELGDRVELRAEAGRIVIEKARGSAVTLQERIEGGTGEERDSH